MAQKPATARQTSASSNQKRSAPAPQHAPAAVAFARAAPDAPAILRMASETIAQRGQARDSDSGGGQERSMAATVAAFNAIEGTRLTERQGWAFMQVLKIVRAAASARNGRRDLDSYLDGTAYAALAGECAMGAYGAQDGAGRA